MTWIHRKRPGLESWPRPSPPSGSLGQRYSVHQLPIQTTVLSLSTLHVTIHEPLTRLNWRMLEVKGRAAKRLCLSLMSKQSKSIPDSLTRKRTFVRNAQILKDIQDRNFHMCNYFELAILNNNLTYTGSRNLMIIPGNTDLNPSNKLNVVEVAICRTINWVDVSRYLRTNKLLLIIGNSFTNTKIQCKKCARVSHMTFQGSNLFLQRFT